MANPVNSSDDSGAQSTKKMAQNSPMPSPTDVGPQTPDANEHRWDRGQSLFEYALIILFVALAVVLSLALIAPALNNIFHQVPNAF
ncbi:MAG TPA: hypothetical protein VKQ36_02940 [Ktedonobacterales bacterium]|nr:hypothetical protein [Ktedonobacterales bacterium]